MLMYDLPRSPESGMIGHGHWSPQLRRPDLSSTASNREPHSLSADSDTSPDTASSRRHVLPRDLPNAIKQLDDQELDRLHAAVLAEQKRHDGKTRATTMGRRND